MTCDRCGKKRFIRGNIAEHGWRSVFEMDICPKCGEKLDTVFKEFMKIEDEDEYMNIVGDFFSGIAKEVILNDQNSTES